MAVGFVLTGIVPYDKLNVPDPIAVGVDAVGLSFLAPIIKLGVSLGLTSVILVALYSAISSTPSFLAILPPISVTAAEAASR